MKDRLLRRKGRLQGLSLAIVIPNMITVAATCAALTGVRFALEGRLNFAVIAILLAAVLDGLDGRMARLLNATSSFGEQMDSLSDVIAFGVAPGLIVYYWILIDIGGPIGGFGWVTALFYTVCCSLRLARFNSRLTTMPAYAYNFFQGVPAPAGAGLMLMPLILSFVLEDIFPNKTIHFPAIGIAIWTIAVGLLMISELPTYSFKKLKIPPSWILPILALLALALAGISGAPWISLLIILTLYLFSIPLSIISYQKLKSAAENLTDELNREASDEAKE